jgi:hypothetical protein
VPRTGRVTGVTEGIQNGTGISRSDGLSPYEANEGVWRPNGEGTRPLSAPVTGPVDCSEGGPEGRGEETRAARCSNFVLVFLSRFSYFFSRPRGRLRRRDNAPGKFCKEMHGEGAFFSRLHPLSHSPPSPQWLTSQLLGLTRVALTIVDVWNMIKVTKRSVQSIISQKALNRTSTSQCTRHESDAAQ